jgi:hypothetical protein
MPRDSLQNIFARDQIAALKEAFTGTFSTDAPGASPALFSPFLWGTPEALGPKVMIGHDYIKLVAPFLRQIKDLLNIADQKAVRLALALATEIGERLPDPPRDIFIFITGISDRLADATLQVSIDVRKELIRAHHMMIRNDYPSGADMKSWEQNVGKALNWSLSLVVHDAVFAAHAIESISIAERQMFDHEPNHVACAEAALKIARTTKDPEALNTAYTVILNHGTRLRQQFSKTQENHTADPSPEDTENLLKAAQRFLAFVPDTVAAKNFFAQYEEATKTLGNAPIRPRWWANERPKKGRTLLQRREVLSREKRKKVLSDLNSAEVKALKDSIFFDAVQSAEKIVAASAGPSRAATTMAVSVIGRPVGAGE